jgi:hypothetical protein
MRIFEVKLNQTDVKRFEADGYTLENDEPRLVILAIHRLKDDGTYEVGFRVRSGEYSEINPVEGDVELDDWTPLPPPVILPSGMVVAPENAFTPVAKPPPAPATKATKEA